MCNNEWLLYHLHVLSRDYRDIRPTLNSIPGPSRPRTKHISQYNTGNLKNMNKIKKNLVIQLKVPLTKNRWRAPFVALN